MKKVQLKGKDLLQEKVIFCSECGAQLENYCFSRGVKDIEAVKKTLAQCRKSGRIHGEFCSKLFIADPENYDALWEEVDKSPRKKGKA